MTRSIVRLIRVMTDTAIPTVFHVELGEVAEAEAAEEAGEGEGVGFQEVMSGTIETIDDETARVPGEDRATADFVDEDEVEVLVCVDETAEDAEETVVVGLPGRDRISLRLGREPWWS